MFTVGLDGWFCEVVVKDCTRVHLQQVPLHANSECSS